ncbi:hypothetical protein MUA02_04390 [Enterobacteriaceae bacterium H20N1]|uniref:Uncharacterized protein n=1 Tax=Dryocola boscaweniae TaxID=2925397 RepID=A0A9X2W5Y9_9ENTR|nr:hypothetical protein [Dryocola boscaweniae]MCT4701206.1 hypothetical protein [Dryocola boscaweniae]MCT4718289.1 hypothetical protein [Dryocola boscaweniae]
MKTSKFNYQRITTDAWKQADYAASIHGGKKSEYFAYCLRLQWARAKGIMSGTAKQKLYAADLCSKVINDIIDMMEYAEKQGVTGYAPVAHSTIEAIDFYRGYAGTLIDTLKDLPSLSKRKTLDDIIKALKND